MRLVSGHLRDLNQGCWVTGPQADQGDAESQPADSKISIDSQLHSASSAGLELMDAPAGSLEAMQSDIAYRGLSVRMSIVSGRAEKVTVHGITRRRDYEGEASLFVLDKCLVLATSVKIVATTVQTRPPQLYSA